MIKMMMWVLPDVERERETMTVQELLDELIKVEDKSIPLIFNAGGSEYPIEYGYVSNHNDAEGYETAVPRCFDLHD